MRTVVCLIWIAVLCGCGQNGEEDNQFLARIGEVKIALSDLEEYEKTLTEDLKTSLVGEAAVRDLLQSLLDTEIMLLEAESKGYNQDPETQKQLHKFRVDRLSGLLLREQLGDRVTVTEGEIEQMYREFHWDRRVWPAHILNATEEDALKVVEELRKGREFSEVARERSTADDAVGGGDLGQYFGPGDAAADLVHGAHGLPVGGVSEPIRTVDGFEVVTILDEQEVSLKEVRPEIFRILHRQNFLKEHGEFVSQLEAKFDVLYHETGIKALLRAGASGAASLPVSDENLALISYSSGGSFSAGEGSRALVSTGKPLHLLTDSVNVVRSLRIRLLSDTLLVREAIARRLDQRPSFLQATKKHRRQLYAGQLRRREVLRKIEITEEEIRQLYERDKDEYRLPMRADVTEILVDSQKRAQELISQIAAGADMGMLAAQYSKRSGARHNRGHLHITQGGAVDWGPLLEQTESAEIGKVVGPIHVGAPGYSLLRVEERAGGMRTLDEVRHILLYKLKRGHNFSAFEQYIADLRSKYADRIEWNDERIGEAGSARSG